MKSVFNCPPAFIDHTGLQSFIIFAKLLSGKMYRTFWEFVLLILKKLSANVELRTHDVVEFIYLFPVINIRIPNYC